MDIKSANVLVCNSHYKSYKHEELEMEFCKNLINCRLGDLREARSVYTQTNALTGKKLQKPLFIGKLFRIHGPRTNN